MIDGFWEGHRWEIVYFGRISEIKLKTGEESCTYLLIFLKDQQGKEYTRQIVAALEKVEESGGEFDVLKAMLNETFQILCPRTIFVQEDLQTLVKSKVPIPEFYKQALAEKVEKIILF